jgi:hypothetical protein
MLLMGMALVGGAAESLVGTTLVPLDQEVGTHASAAGAVLGIGLMAAAVKPAANVGWVRAGILYGFVVLAFEAGQFYEFHQFHLGPVFFGLAFSLLLIALYPQRRALVPETTRGAKTAAVPPPPAKPVPAGIAKEPDETVKSDESEKQKTAEM